MNDDVRKRIESNIELFYDLIFNSKLDTNSFPNYDIDDIIGICYLYLEKYDLMKIHLNKSINKGNYFAMIALGVYYGYIEKNLELTIKYLKMAAELDSVWSLVLLTRIFFLDNDKLCIHYCKLLLQRTYNENNNYYILQAILWIQNIYYKKWITTYEVIDLYLSGNHHQLVVNELIQIYRLEQNSHYINSKLIKNLFLYKTLIDSLCHAYPSSVELINFHMYCKEKLKKK